ncbi:DUF3035 domain-containing protein [Sphingomonas sp. LaA6.9]|uniref:DUF3035 domain-containing protein n=1 Tax=Sphingomonas sp. LaA6.9 TaxID=2919914 RepID=UPI001F4F9107|nr:DUF3035 domain-containing protein [Sphingomonas sp. LaA6.9]MCJ8156711.1 DUF3035 domain-containing protein [Sphingomonas sp. LaA6.9]
MRKTVIFGSLGLAALTLSACASGGITNRDRPDEFATARKAPLVIPPDFALVPPKPGAPRPQETDSATQALQAMFGGPAPRSTSETGVITQAGGNRADAGIRSGVGDPDTNVVDKGSVTRDIVAAPEGDGQDARASTPQ